MKVDDLIKSEEVIEPDTIAMFFPELNSLERQKIYVEKVLRDTRAAYEDMDVFENAVLILNDLNSDISKMEGSKPKHLWKALKHIKSIHPDIEFSHEILLYIKMMCQEEGLEFYPPGIGLDEENSIYDAVVERSKKGPFPLGEDFLGIQAAKLLKIELYVGE